MWATIVVGAIASGCAASSTRADVGSDATAIDDASSTDAFACPGTFVERRTECPIGCGIPVFRLGDGSCPVRDRREQRWCVIGAGEVFAGPCMAVVVDGATYVYDGNATTTAIGSPRRCTSAETTDAPACDDGP